MLMPGEALFTSSSRLMKVESALGDDALFIKSLKGTEALSSLPQIRVELLSYEEGINPLDAIGELLKITIDPAESDAKRFSGYVAEFEYIGPCYRGLYGYSATLVPWFWLLKKRTNCRVFQNKTVQNIVEEICSFYDFAKFKFALSEPLNPLPYCVQYQESDFDFLCRLLESEGIFYYFSYAADGHTLQLVDANTALTLVSDLAVTNVLDGTTKIRKWRHRYRYCSTKISINDFDYEKANHSLLSETTSVLSLKNGDKLSQYHYPGTHKETEQGERLAKLLMEENESQFSTIYGESECTALALGTKFTYRTRSGSADNGKIFVITEISHEALDNSFVPESTEANVYRNSLTCLPEEKPFRPHKSTKKPSIDGVQTAIVVGKSGDEIYTDNYGRIKIQFHWDLYGEKNESSSCWVRVATPWAGKKWGSLAIPRVGNEVIVTFEEGDPDRPLVIGCVYNSMHMPPYDLPSQKTVHGVKSRSTKGGDRATYNEISFDDTKGSEALTIHAQKDFNMNVGNNAGVSATGNSTTSVDGDTSTTVGGNSTVTITGNHDQTITGNATNTIEGNETIAVTGDRGTTTQGNESLTISGDQTINTTGKQDVSVSGDQTTNVTGEQRITANANQTINTNADQVISASGSQSINGDSQTIKANGTTTVDSPTIELKGGTTASITVGGSSITVDGTSITLAFGASSVKIDAMGVSVSGPLVKLN